MPCLLEWYYQFTFSSIKHKKLSNYLCLLMQDYNAPMTSVLYSRMFSFALYRLIIKIISRPFLFLLIQLLNFEWKSCHVLLCDKKSSLPVCISPRLANQCDPSFSLSVFCIQFLEYFAMFFFLLESHMSKSETIRILFCKKIILLKLEVIVI